MEAWAKYFTKEVNNIRNNMKKNKLEIDTSTNAIIQLGSHEITNSEQLTLQKKTKVEDVLSLIHI